MSKRSFFVAVIVEICAMGALPAVVSADTAASDSNAAAATLPAGGQGNPPSGTVVDDFFKNWFARVDRTQAMQPHWVTPLVTVTPRLEEEFRYDQYWESLPAKKILTNYGAGKGLELIPAEPVEVIIGVPPWESENTRPPKRGWGDESVLLKYRLFSANEEQGNYILTAFMGVTAPWGGEHYTQGHYVYTPTIAGGKGWGNFDVQATFGVAIPDDGGSRQGPGTALTLNAALQYRVLKILWPEVELNGTYWPNGKHEGINDQSDQVFITPGLIIGRIPLTGRLALTVGAGYQIAVSPRPMYYNNFIVTARLPF